MQKHCAPTFLARRDADTNKSPPIFRRAFVVGTSPQAIERHHGASHIFLFYRDILCTKNNY
jgi:hypothetical protein